MMMMMMKAVFDRQPSHARASSVTREGERGREKQNGKITSLTLLLRYNTILKCKTRWKWPCELTACSQNKHMY